MAIRYDLGPLTILIAQTFGEPGQRTFRIVAGDGRTAVAVWMEKEQLKALADAIDEMLIRMRSQAATDDGPPRRVRREPDTLVPDPDVEFQVGQVSLGFDRELDLFVLMAWDLEEVDEEDATFAGRATRDQLRLLSQEVGEIYVAGRPKCPMCGLPVDPRARARGEMDHHCLRRNGHYKIPIDD